ncbi:RDD family protein [Loktanella sp. IMCC34160]|uniref:RDD family protein n=1 Tax=Loktanella sp. IMCC34160 TaxID=2510646 RepID=UPI00101CD94F|nr:RDD family protein [Loktanella sp. IMCC34160]RYG90834.1 RDD family protein [Loktanella sp. IMCC34160]
MSAADYSASLGLPDPAHQPEVYAGVLSKRLIAWIVDATIVAILAGLALPFTAFVGVLFFPAMMLVIGFFYRWWTIAGTGATWGMRLMAVELRNTNRQKLDSGEAFLHTLGFTVSITVAPLQLVSIVLMLLSDRRQGLTDMVMNTAMVNRLAR